MLFSRPLSALTVLLLATSAALPAQTAGSSSNQVAHAGSPRSSNVPYTSNHTITTVQTLANGTTITHTLTTKIARDSEGRTYDETHQTLRIGADSQPSDVVAYNVSDPVVRTYITWYGNSKIAVVTHMPNPKTPQHRTQPPGVDAARELPAGRQTQQQTREDLGIRTIAGIEAKGTHATGMIPAGDQGNDQPLTIETENWISTQYNVPLLTITNDPRMGKRTDEVTEFQPGEPDPALFRIPNGYTVRKRAF